MTGPREAAQVMRRVRAAFPTQRPRLGPRGPEFPTQQPCLGPRGPEFPTQQPGPGPRDPACKALRAGRRVSAVAPGLAQPRVHGRPGRAPRPRPAPNTTSAPEGRTP
ncbi:hypothetical protein [Streptomyces sp. NPDC050145]|uniref:hypothetical protein n=1 Tax=Streptomyces sp. NPDC050145 TaxID=3365602 RepID=UPI0037A9B321